MASRNNREKQKRALEIDNSSMNLLLVILVTVILLLVILAAYLTITLITKEDALAGLSGDGKDPANNASTEENYPFNVEGITVNIPSVNEAKNTISADLLSSTNAILVDVTANEIVASRQGGQIIYPASMTKVMTLIVVAENLKSEASLNDVLTINIPRGEHSGYGFEVGEKLTVKDLIYAAVLQSDGVACITLAEYIAGSEAAFVKLMNEKAREMGLSQSTTLFQNCSGLHHEYHYSTCHDMAVIMAYAMKNPFCANVLTSLSYKPSDNFRPGEGCTFWHAFLHNHLSDGNKQPASAEILGGKTGWTGKTSGYCIVAYAKGDDGHYYVSVTAKADSWVGNVDDIFKIFNTYVK